MVITCAATPAVLPAAILTALLFTANVRDVQAQRKKASVHSETLYNVTPDFPVAKRDTVRANCLTPSMSYADGNIDPAAYYTDTPPWHRQPLAPAPNPPPYQAKQPSPYSIFDQAIRRWDQGFFAPWKPGF